MVCCLLFEQAGYIGAKYLTSVSGIFGDRLCNMWWCFLFAGSLASSDLFYDAYGPKGLAREALCPCAGSPETLTVSVRR